MWQLARNILLIIICCSANLVHAEYFDNNYQVEVIIFEHTSPKRFASEHWPKFVGQLETTKAINLNDIESPETSSLADKEGISLVGPQQMLLKSDLSKIKTSKGARLIQFKAWRQPMITGDRSTPIYFTDPKGQEIAAIFAVKPMRNNVFSIKIDLIYKLQADEAYLASAVREIRFTTDAKVKKKEVYYIDHPVIGILVAISPVATS